MERDGSSAGYIDGILKAVRSWLSHNEIELKRKIKIANRDATPTLQNERVPTLEELRTILLHASDRAKVMISMIAESHGKITHPYRVFFMGHAGLRQRPDTRS